MNEFIGFNSYDSKNVERPCWFLGYQFLQPKSKLRRSLVLSTFIFMDKLLLALAKRGVLELQKA